MNLLEKFDTVEVNVDSHISDADKQFCEQQQAAYTAALYGFQELTYFWEGMLAEQKALLGQPDSPFSDYNQYLASSGDDGPKITIHRLRVQIDALHRKFLHKLADYFQSAYAITIQEDALEAALFPPRPVKFGKNSKQELKEYLLWSSTVHLRYEDVATHILRQFDGRQFSEQSLLELCRRCNEDVWSGSKHTARFERKYAVISFLDCFCSFRYDREDWELTDKMKTVLLCVAHFETGCIGSCPAGFLQPPFKEHITVNSLDFPGCERLAQMRLFKNGRVDLRFTSEDNANRFIDTYIGRAYQGQVSE